MPGMFCVISAPTVRVCVRSPVNFIELAAENSDVLRTEVDPAPEATGFLTTPTWENIVSEIKSYVELSNLV